MKKLYKLLGTALITLTSFAPTKAINLGSINLERKLCEPPITNQERENDQYLKIKNILEERLSEINLVYTQCNIRSRMPEIEQNEDLNPEAKDDLLSTLNLAECIYELATEDFMGGTIRNQGLYKQLANTINNGPIKGILYEDISSKSILYASFAIRKCIKSYELTKECINNDYKEYEKKLIDKIIKTEDFAPGFFISPPKEEYDPRPVFLDEITFPPVWKK